LAIAMPMSSHFVLLATLCSDLQCSTGERIPVENAGNYKTVVQAPPVEYYFDSARSNKRNKYVWPGLESYGPFSRGNQTKNKQRIRQTTPTNCPCL
jgi:hypothetical protein